MSVVLVDWLGRGGIAQTTEAWAIELRRLGAEVFVVTRPGRDLLNSVESGAEVASDRLGRVGAHRSVVASAASLIKSERPAGVIIQNYVIPMLERPVLAAAESVGADVIIVVHDHQMHTWRAGTRAGLRESLRRATLIVAHSAFVGDRVSSFAGRDVLVIPHPRVVGALAEPDAEPILAPGRPGDRLALHFGIVNRQYKGADVVVEMARLGLAGWRFACVGVGAPSGTRNLTSVARFLSEGELAAAVAASDVTLLPYRRASQSGAVSFAQSSGSVPIASAVGGIPEQIRHRESGLLVPPGATAAEWIGILAELDEQDLERMKLAGRDWVDQCHRHFTTSVGTIYARCAT
jgi:glycosyltransferase involved in cell wall biosynthesis